MKKALLFVLLLAATSVAKAQNQSLKLNQPFNTKDRVIKIDTVLPKLTQRSPDLSPLQKQKLTALLALKPETTKPVYDEVFYSNMPVAGASSRDSNMPVVKTDDIRTRYNMPIKRIAIVDPTKAKPSVATP